ncbi:hypothetical protein, partial [Streptomyces sp. NPDC091217]|uniref:hypothetical protein n=1 Tax=Streptomyces sp. NPDC091217 TaxID=3365975 RepID=UPI00381D6A36
MSRALPKYRKRRVAMIGSTAAVVLSGAVITGSALAGQSGSSDDSKAMTKSAATTVSCPDVAARLKAVPAAAKAEVDRDLALLTTQIQEANNRLAGSVGQGGAGFVQNAILKPLKDKRVATIDRIVKAVGGTAGKRQVDTLATCTLNNGGNTGNAGGNNAGNCNNGAGAAQGNGGNNGAGAAQGNGGKNARGAAQGTAGNNAGGAAQGNAGNNAGGNGHAGMKQGNGGGAAQGTAGSNAGGAAQGNAGNNGAGAAQGNAGGAAQGNAGSNAGGAAQGSGGNNAGGNCANNGNNGGGSGSNAGAGVANTVSCPDVAARLKAVPAAAKAEVDRDLALLTTQIQEANNRLAGSVGQGGADFVQNAILKPLKDKRVATIDRIVKAVGGTAGK